MTLWLSLTRPRRPRRPRRLSHGLRSRRRSRVCLVLAGFAIFGSEELGRIGTPSNQEDNDDGGGHNSDDEDDDGDEEDDRDDN